MRYGVSTNIVASLRRLLRVFIPFISPANFLTNLDIITLCSRQWIALCSFTDARFLRIRILSISTTTEKAIEK